MNFTKTVFSVCYPQTQAVINQFCMSEMSELYIQTWSKKQDSYHKSFISTWKTWVPATLPQLNFEYPSNGSSEAIREQIVYLHSQGKKLVVFEGEYEGYAAIASAVGMPYREIEKNRYKEAVLEDCEVFFLSEPSSIDGNSWSEFADFMSMGWPTYVDLAYCGSFKANTLNLDYPNVEGIFFSLSKVFGVYYHRIGGCLLKDANPLLYGNMWFKNIFSMRIGEALMQRVDLDLLQKELKKFQNLVLDSMPDFKASDVPLLATTVQDSTKEWQKDFVRHKNSERLRVCLSPMIETMIRA